jgi:hypothetical protein
MRNEVRRRRAVLAAVVAAALAVGGAARAETPAPALEAELRAWLGAVLGPRIALGERPVRVSPRDGAYAIEIPLAGAIGASGIAIEAPPITLAARPRADGRWALDDIHLPSPMQIRAAGPAEGEAREWTLRMAEQDAHALLDPTLATESTWDGVIGGYTNLFRSKTETRRTEIARIATHARWRPAREGRIDVQTDSTGELIAANARLRNGAVAAFSAAEARVATRIDGLRPAALPPLLHAAFDVAPLAASAVHDPMAAAGHAMVQHGDIAALLPPDARIALRAALDAAADLLDGFAEEATFRNVRWRAGTVDGSAREVAMKLALAAPDGRLAAHFRFAVDGAGSEAVPPGPLRQILPRHIAIAPRIGGLSAERLHALLAAALKDGASNAALEAEAQALLREGPLTIGLDELTADAGPALLHGKGEVRVAAPDAVAGEARIRATGLDALIRLAGQVPELKAALPVLFFLKGIGEPDGDATVWNLEYRDGKFLVNGTDFSTMVPGR